MPSTMLTVHYIHVFNYVMYFISMYYQKSLFIDIVLNFLEVFEGKIVVVIFGQI